MADETLDCMGMVCPRPLFETIKRMKRMEVGRTILVTGDYPLSLAEIKEHMLKTGHEVVSEGRDGQIWRIEIRKRR
jgi:TusA-related sulfurtransferase